MNYSRLTYKCYHFLAVDTFLYKYSVYRLSENYFEEIDKERIESYKIYSINRVGKVIRLIISQKHWKLLPPPVIFADYL